MCQNLEGRDDFEEPGIDGKAILKQEVLGRAFHYNLSI
jgi:hypothetical protein